MSFESAAEEWKAAILAQKRAKLEATPEGREELARLEKEAEERAAKKQLRQELDELHKSAEIAKAEKEARAKRRAQWEKDWKASCEKYEKEQAELKAKRAYFHDIMCDFPERWRAACIAMGRDPDNPFPTPGI
jgi:colicin import membrane protein